MNNPTPAAVTTADTDGRAPQCMYSTASVRTHRYGSAKRPKNATIAPQTPNQRRPSTIDALPMLGPGRIWHALSHALNRLRYLLKDQLFIRTPKGMVPTPRAEQLALPLRQALSDMQRALEPEAFVPAEASRRFSIAVNNYAAIVLAAPLVAAVFAAAPLLQLDLRPSGTLDVFELLDHGDLDIAIGTFNDVGERFATAKLLEDEFVAVMRRSHPAGRRPLSTASFGAPSMHTSLLWHRRLDGHPAHRWLRDLIVSVSSEL
jgi:DNA-binding transcriptional LysR family regulator